MGHKKQIVCLTIAIALGYLYEGAAFARGYGTPYASYLPPVQINDYSEVRTGSSPDNSYELFTSLIDSSQNSIRLGAYLLRSPGITRGLVKAAKRGLKVTVLLDGWTVARPRAQKMDDL